MSYPYSGSGSAPSEGRLYLGKVFYTDGISLQNYQNPALLDETVVLPKHSGWSLEGTTKLTDEDCDAYIRSGRLEIITRMSRNAHIKPEYLQRIAEYPDINVKRSVAVNSNITAETMDYLMADERALVRMSLVRNSSTPADMIVDLWRDFSQALKKYELLKSMNNNDAYRDSIEVLTYFVGNSNTPNNIVQDILNRYLGLIATYRGRWFTDVQLNDVQIDRMLAHKDSKVRAVLLNKRDLPDAVLSKIAKDESDEVLFSLANYRDVSEEILGQLARHPKLKVAVAIASNRAASPEVLSFVYERFVKEKNETIDVLQTYAEFAMNQSTSSQLLFDLACERHSDTEHIGMVLNNPNFNATLTMALLELYYSMDFEESVKFDSVFYQIAKRFAWSNSLATEDFYSIVGRSDKTYAGIAFRKGLKEELSRDSAKMEKIISHARIVEKIDATIPDNWILRLIGWE